MMKDIISNLPQLQAVLPKEFDLDKEVERVSALKHYLSKGGVLHVAPNQDGWPKLLYPTKSHLKKKIEDLRFLRSQYGSRLSSWEKKFNDAKSYHLVNNVKKLKEPLFWKHMAKCAVDPDYKADSEKVHLPAHLVADARWKPMVKMFVADLDYRKQLVQTVDESIVYKKDKRVAQYADLLQKFRMEQSNRKIDELQKKLAVIDTDISAMQELTKWASF